MKPEANSATHQRAPGSTNHVTDNNGSLHLHWEHCRPRVHDFNTAHMWLLFRTLRGIDLHYHLPSQLLFTSALSGGWA